MSVHPRRIPRDAAPGGYVARTYSPTGKVVLEQTLYDTSDPQVMAQLVQDSVVAANNEFEASGAAIFVIYDGVTGELIWEEAAVPPNAG